MSERLHDFPSPATSIGRPPSSLSHSSRFVKAVAPALRGHGEKRLALAHIARRADLAPERERPLQLRVGLRPAAFLDELRRRAQPRVSLARAMAYLRERIGGSREVTSADERGRSRPRGAWLLRQPRLVLLGESQVAHHPRRFDQRPVVENERI